MNPPPKIRSLVGTHAILAAELPLSTTGRLGFGCGRLRTVPTGHSLVTLAPSQLGETWLMLTTMASIFDTVIRVRPDAIQTLCPT